MGCNSNKKMIFPLLLLDKLNKAIFSHFHGKIGAIWRRLWSCAECFLEPYVFRAAYVDGGGGTVFFSVIMVLFLVWAVLR